MPDITRRHALLAAGIATLGLAAPRLALAKSSDPISLVVPYGGGGLIDGLVRQISELLTRELGQPVIVENKPGANGIVGGTYAAAARPDGQTYFIGATGPLSLNVMLRKGLPYSLESFAPVGTMMSGPLTITVPTALGVGSLEELKAHAAKTGKPLRYATLGPGSVTHLFGKVLQQALDVPMVDVAYRNNPSSVVDTLGGQVDLNFATPIDMIEHVKTGELKILAISTPERDPNFPELPTTTELGYPQLVSSFWFGMLAPKGTPAAEIDRMSAALQKAVADPAFQEKMASSGMHPDVGGPAAMQAQLEKDAAFWGKVIQENDIVLN